MLLFCTEKIKCNYQRKVQSVKCIPAKMQCVNCMQMSYHFLRAHLLPLEKESLTLKHAVHMLFISYYGKPKDMLCKFYFHLFLADEIQPKTYF